MFIKTKYLFVYSQWNTDYLRQKKMSDLFFHTLTTSMFDWIKFVSFTQIKNY